MPKSSALYPTIRIAGLQRSRPGKLWQGRRFCGTIRLTCPVKYRVAIWTSVGFLVAAFWAIYFFPTATNIIANRPGTWVLARFTCPVTFAASYFRFGISLYWVLLANAATYALVGTIIESSRKQAHQTR